MFGYLRPLKPELKISEYQTYNAVYCGFCRALGASGKLLRLTLSYDFTFFSILSFAVKEDFCGFETCRCPVKLFTKKACVKQSESLNYASDLAILMLYGKLKDNISDRDGALLSRLALLYLMPRYKKAAKRRSQENEALLNYLAAQKECEKQKCGIDACAHPTASLLSSFFEKLSQDNEQRESLSRLGYVLGRWIYILDAADDLEKDLKKGSFNPLTHEKNLSQEEIKNIKSEAELSLNIAISDACDTFLKLKLHHFGSIIENIIFLGLKNTQSVVLHAQNKKERKLYLNGKSL